MPWNHARELRERIARFDESIGGFLRTREEIVARRRGAADHIMVELDERLVVNRRTVEALERSRDLSKEDLQRIEGQRAPRFVVVDDDIGGQAFLAKTLGRSFPQAEIIGCEESGKAMQELRAGQVAVFLVHRAKDADGLLLVEMLRAASATVPIVHVSSIDRNDAALALGATTFLLLNQSEMIVPVVQDLLQPPSASASSLG
jgi:hypothetical protein